MILEFENLQMTFDHNRLFTNISARINRGDRIGLIGDNGTGKTTLCKILADEILPDDGKVILAPNAKIAYISRFDQVKELTENQDKTVRDCLVCLEGHEEVYRLLRYKNVDLEKKVAHLSGGEKTKLGVIVSLFSEHNILILDEPTNHLDINNIELLIKLLTIIDKTIIMVSHNMHFINNTANKIFELSPNGIDQFNGNYDDYVSEKLRRMRSHKAQIERQKREIKRLEDIVERITLISQASTSRKHGGVVQNKKKTLQRAIDKQIDERIEMKQPEFSMIDYDGAEIDTDKVAVKLSGYTKSFDDLMLLEDADLTVNYGEKIALVGKNGSGKSTVLKSIMGELDYDGQIVLDEDLDVEYFSQSLGLLKRENTILEEFLDYGTTIFELEEIVELLGFEKKDVNRKINSFSLGEINRIACMKLAMSNRNCLLLDEFDNYFDASSKQLLIQALKKYQGTIIAVSHDKDFIKQWTTGTYEIKGKTFKPYTHKETKRKKPRGRK